MFLIVYHLLLSLVCKSYQGRSFSFFTSISQELKYYLTLNIQNYLFSESMEYSRVLEMQVFYAGPHCLKYLQNSIGGNVSKIFKDKEMQNMMAFSD